MLGAKKNLYIGIIACVTKGNVITTMVGET